MFRDKNVSSKKFIDKFQELIDRLEKKVEIHLDSEYHNELKSYIYKLKSELELQNIDDKVLNDMREVHMSSLNRLQKLKNRTSYKKDKHKLKTQNQDWG
jgi:predicted RND superfamily exporter protein